MDLGLRGKIAIVLGASKGMGRASARALAKEGCSLALAARDIDVLSKVASDLAAECSVQVSSLKCDVTTSSSTTAAARSPGR
jgi:short-subunit dehydrogenase